MSPNSRRLPGTWPTSLSPSMIARQRTVGSPKMAPDGRSIAFTSEFDARTDLFTLAPGRWPVQITAEQAVAVGSYGWSPDGSQLVFTAASDGKLWLGPAAGGQPRRLTLGAGRDHAPRFAPDGRSISFLRDRGDTIEVVVVSTDGSWQRILSRGTDFPMDPSWSPDSARLVWHAYPYDQMPWDESVLVVAELAGGQPRQIAGGARVTYANARFSPDGRKIACVCDRSGALNLTEIAADGSDQRLLHEDRWEHGEPAYSPDGRWLAFTRNADGDYAIWVAPSGGGTARPLSDRPGHATAPSWSPDGQRIIHLYDSPVAPPEVWQVEVASGRAEQLTFAALGGLPTEDMVMPEHVSWTSPDGFEVNGLLFTPRDVRPGQHPCLVGIHGGPMNQSRSVWSGLTQFLVQRGWVVIEPNYRGTLGYGRAYREALFTSWGKGDLEDNLGGVDLCLKRNLIRPDRVVAWGGSAGGYSTLVCVTAAPDRFAGGVSLYGLFDLFTFGLETHRYERYYVETILGPSSENYALWHERSPINYLDRVRVPMIFLHGLNDPAALLAQSDTVVEELRRRGVDCVYVKYPNEGHGFRHVEHVADHVWQIDRYLQQKVLRAPEPGPLGTLPYPPMPLAST
jgi:dipeptidyl aminopeptidase/acylaminoacyl peptidase